MIISGYTFIRNATLLYYPIIESISSILPLCDEFIVNVGDSSDNTLDLIKSIKNPKIKILESIWPADVREGGRVFYLQSMKALSACSGNWAFYIDADMVLHEQYLERVHDKMSAYLNQPDVEGLLFDFVHFFGSYKYVAGGRKWFRKEIRIIRNKNGIEPWGDTQGFRRMGKKLRVKHTGATIFHYGWCRPPNVMKTKQIVMDSLYHDNEWIQKHHPDPSGVFDYCSGGKLVAFSGTHPSVMNNRVDLQNWIYNYDPAKVQQSLKEKILDTIEAKCGWRIGEYKNYELI
jgi:glycosyltransferase involved in cell wall biosynthesis